MCFIAEESVQTLHLAANARGSCFDEMFQDPQGEATLVDVDSCVLAAHLRSSLPRAANLGTLELVCIGD